MINWARFDKHGHPGYGHRTHLHCFPEEQRIGHCLSDIMLNSIDAHLLNTA